MQWARPIVALLTLITLSSYGCSVPYWVVHRKDTPVSKKTRIAGGPETRTVRELTLSSGPTPFNPHTPLTLAYFERVTGPEEEVATYAERKYLHEWSPLAYIEDYLMGITHPTAPQHKEWGCPYTKEELRRYAVRWIRACTTWRGGHPIYMNLPDRDEIRPTGLRAEKRKVLAQQPLEVKVAARGVNWQKETVTTVVTNDEGQQTVLLDGLFKDFPDAPSEATFTVTAEGSETTMFIDSELWAALYRQENH